jgi:hypothetical protein
MPATQPQILERAERLASNLVGGSTKVGKNVLLSIVADFMSARDPDRDHLRTMLRLIQDGSGGHIKRGDGYGDQVRLAVREISETLQEEFTDEELKSIFGWTARLLLVRREHFPRKTEVKPRGEARGPRPTSHPSQGPERIGPLDSKSLSALEKLRQQLQNKEKGGKE